MTLFEQDGNLWPYDYSLMPVEDDSLAETDDLGHIYDGQNVNQIIPWYDWGGSNLNIGDKWPIIFQIRNDLVNAQSTVALRKETLFLERTYEESFPRDATCFLWLGSLDTNRCSVENVTVSLEETR